MKTTRTLTADTAPAPRTIRGDIAGVLAIDEPAALVMATRALVRDWRAGRISHRFEGAMPQEPARPARPLLLRPGEMPKRGKAGSRRGQIALIHALAHIEYVAIALALDMAGRFGDRFPRSFVDDWLSVAADEAMHFVLLDRRLRAMGSGYGALPAHGGMWATAQATAGDPLARLALVPMVLEARGLDVTPATIARFAALGDGRTASVLDRIYRDEIRHVAIGTRWFKWACDDRRLDAPDHWKAIVRAGFHGSLRPPFNDSARNAAGLTQEFYAAVD